MLDSGLDTDEAAAVGLLAIESDTPSEMDLQQTIGGAVSLSGRGLFGGQPVKVHFEPAPADHGIVFTRVDQGGVQIPAHIENVIEQERRTSLRSGSAVIETCEHCLSALAALNIDNVLAEVDGSELPGGDGSASSFVEVLSEAGLSSNGAPRRRFRVREPIVLRDGKATIAAIPCDEPKMHVIYELEYPPNRGIDRQLLVFDCAHDDYARQLAPARTFLLEEEARAFQDAGLGSHLTEKDLLVISPDGDAIGNTFRFENEMVRHKVVDLIGDLYLLGAPIQGRIIAHRSGHQLNHALVRKLLERYRSQNRREMAHREGKVDIRSLLRIMPHRYPMLLVDRVIQIEGDQRIVGVKNVTINEPFFQGHYPGTPVMPGVLIVEAMAQLSGVLIGQKLEHAGKLGILMGLDRVKLRRMVTPGDQIILEAVALRVRSRIAHMQCKAYVGDDVAAEAEVKYLLVDDEK